MKVVPNEKRKKLHGFSYYKNIANFEAFCWDKNFSKNLLFLGSVILSTFGDWLSSVFPLREPDVAGPEHPLLVVSGAANFLVKIFYSGQVHMATMS